MRVKRYIPIYLWGVTLWIITVVAKWKFHGLVFGLDYSLYQPDGALYTVKTLQILGYDQISAINEVVSWYEVKSPHLVEEVRENLKPNSHLWGVVSTRLLYPLLSAPLVHSFGIVGMLIFPAISYLILIIVVLMISIKNQTQTLGIILVLILTISPTVTRWMLVNYTDSLLAALFAITSYVILASQSRIKLFYLILFLIIISSFTRFCLPIWLCLLVSMDERFSLKRKVLLAITSVLLSIPSVLTTDNAFLPSDSDSSLSEKLTILPLTFAKTLAFEFVQLLALDRALLGLVLASVYIGLLNFNNNFSRYFLFCLVGTLSLTAINGVCGVNFRYQLPLIPFMMLILLNKELTRNSVTFFKRFVYEP